MRTRIVPGAATVVGVLALTALGCAINPATGKRQLSFISESQEVQMGRVGSRQVEQSMGLYPDAKVQSFVESMGLRLARTSERSNLPWNFKVVDDPVVNAFALPGGFIFVTRGIMSHLNSEAELAQVMGHEIGHVTARHSVEQISRAQLLQSGFGVASVFAPAATYRFGGLLSNGLGLLFLKYSRGDERQADRLGVRYALRAGFDPRQAVKVYEMLERQEEQAGGRGVPGWLSTHPTPEHRVERLHAQVDTIPPARLKSARVGHDSFLKLLDGMVYGKNPRNGFFRDGRFLQPDLKFRFDFPEGWKTRNLAQSVAALSPRRDAILELSFAEVPGNREAARAFLTQQGISSTDIRGESINGYPATTGRFSARTQQGTLSGVAAFLDYGGATYQIVGYTARRLSAYERTFWAAIRSFDELTDPSALSVKPMRIEVITTRVPVSISNLTLNRPSPISTAELALLNGVLEDDVIPAGTKIKWVNGDKPPGSDEPSDRESR
ncbi:MAG: M48 family metalloprotease [Gemmatimonadota bacterium]